MWILGVLKRFAICKKFAGKCKHYDTTVQRGKWWIKTISNKKTLLRIQTFNGGETGQTPAAEGVAKGVVEGVAEGKGDVIGQRGVINAKEGSLIPLQSAFDHLYFSRPRYVSFKFSNLWM